MNRKPTYEEIANDIELWKEYVDPDANMTDEEFEAMTIEERIALQVEIWGEEEEEEYA